MANGHLNIGGVSAHDKASTPDAVATVFVYGPKGALKGTELIDRENAEQAARELDRVLGRCEITADEANTLLAAIGHWDGWDGGDPVVDREILALAELKLSRLAEGGAGQREPLNAYVVNVPERADGIYLFEREADAVEFRDAVNAGRMPGWGDPAEMQETPLVGADVARELIDQEKDE